MKSDNNLVSWVGSGFAGIFTAIQENPVIQTISFILTIVSVLVSLAFNIYKWYKNAKADKRITEDEVDELIEIVGNHGDKLTKNNKKKG